MPHYVEPISLCAFVLFWGYVVWSWIRWLRSSEDVRARHRVFVALVGLCLASVSTLISAFLYVHAAFTGGFPLNSAIELLCINAGTLSALLGLVGAFVGAGKLRVPVFIISALNLLLWFIDAAAQ